MALRHAVLASLLDEERSGYQLAKAFDVGVANFWHALPQQLYAELTKLEQQGLITGHDVPQAGRPTKRMFRATDAGRAELDRFVAAESKPSVIRDDLLVKIQAADHVDLDELIGQLEQRAQVADGKIGLFESLLRKLRGDRSEADFLRDGTPLGPYLTCLRGLEFERGNRDWCRRTAAVLTDRKAARVR